MFEMQKRKRRILIYCKSMFYLKDSDRKSESFGREYVPSDRQECKTITKFLLILKRERDPPCTCSTNRSKSSLHSGSNVTVLTVHRSWLNPLFKIEIITDCLFHFIPIKLIICIGKL